MRRPPDSIAVRLAPMPGEAIDSWLEAYARKLRCSAADVLDHGGVKSSYSNVLSVVPWTPATDPDDFAVLATLTGTALPTLNAMTFAHYDGTLMTLAPTTHSRGPTRWWNHTIGSRFCPQCLAETGGRWKLEWRLAWVFACLQHATLLAGHCPACGMIPRDKSWSFRQRRLPECPHACRSTRTNRNRAPDSPNRTAIGDGYCTYDLSETPVHPLLPAGQVITAQAHIISLISQVTAGGQSPGNSARQLSEFDDLFVVARSALASYSRSSPTDVPGRIAAIAGELGPDRIDPAHQWSGFGPRRYDVHATAFALSVAVHARAVDDGGLDPEVMSWLARHEMHETEAGYAQHVLDRWAQASPQARQSILAAIGPHLRPTQQLRYRTYARSPAPPQPGITVRRARQVPNLFWRGWAVRLNPGRYTPGAFRATLTSMILLVGNDDAEGQIEIDAGRQYGGGRARPYWLIAQLVKERLIEPVLTTLTQLADHLDREGSPIDYTRRRALFTSADLDWELLRHEFDRLGLQYPKPIDRQYYRLRLVELLTGEHPGYERARTRARSYYEVSSYDQSSPRFSSDVAAHLREQARRHIRSAGLDEPVEWEPPTQWVCGISWPGRDPDDIDVRALHNMLQKGRSIGLAADRLGTTMEHVRVAALRHPRPTTPHKKVPTARLPTADEMRQVRNAGGTLASLARKYECGPHVIKRLSVRYGILFPSSGWAQYRVDPSWLREQIVQQQRTLVELGEELGVSAQRLGQLAREHEIPVRNGGGGTRRHPLGSLGGPRSVPPMYWDAFKPPAGLQRVRRLIETPRHDTFRDAAKHLGTSTRALQTQFSGLERAAGTRLLERDAMRSQAWTTRLTADGERFVEGAQRLIEQLNSLDRQTRHCAAHPAVEWLNAIAKQR